MKTVRPATDHVDEAPRRPKTIRGDYRLPFKRAALIWLPFVVMLFMTAVTLAPTFFKVGEAIPSSLLAFVCFLPMAFLFVANASLTEISGLEARIRDLENRNA